MRRIESVHRAGTPVDRVGLVILVHDNWDDLEACLSSLGEGLRAPATPIVVDNASEANLAERAHGRFPGTVGVRARENYRYAGGNNLGARFAVEEGAEYVYFLNDDTLPVPGFVRRCLDTARTRGAEIVGSVVTDCGEPPRLQAAGNEIDVRRSTVNEIGKKEEYSEAWRRDREVDAVCGAGFMVSADLFRRLGGFDESYVFYFEEVDLCLRAAALGERSMISGESVVRHKGSSSVTDRHQAYYWTKSYLWFAAVHFGKVWREATVRESLGIVRHFALERGPLLGLYAFAGWWTGMILGVRRGLVGES